MGSGSMTEAAVELAELKSAMAYLEGNHRPLRSLLPDLLLEQARQCGWSPPTGDCEHCKATGPCKLVSGLVLCEACWLNWIATTERVAEVIYRNDGGLTDEDYEALMGRPRKLWKHPDGWLAPDHEKIALAEHERDEYRYQARAVLASLWSTQRGSPRPVAEELTR